MGNVYISSINKIENSLLYHYLGSLEDIDDEYLQQLYNSKKRMRWVV